MLGGLLAIVRVQYRMQNVLAISVFFVSSKPGEASTESYFRWWTLQIRNVSQNSCTKCPSLGYTLHKSCVECLELNELLQKSLLDAPKVMYHIANFDFPECGIPLLPGSSQMWVGPPGRRRKACLIANMLRKFKRGSLKKYLWVRPPLRLRAQAVFAWKCNQGHLPLM